MNINIINYVLSSDKPSTLIKSYEKTIFEIIPQLENCKGFKQNSKYHQYDVYEHILHVVDNTPNDFVLRLSALFHDIGKPSTYTEDKNGVGHFYEHWLISEQIFQGFAIENGLDDEIRQQVGKLVLYHDINIDQLNENEIRYIMHIFSKEELKKLFELKKADLLAHNDEYHYLLDKYEEEEVKLLNKYERK